MRMVREPTLWGGWKDDMHTTTKTTVWVHHEVPPSLHDPWDKELFIFNNLSCHGDALS